MDDLSRLLDDLSLTPALDDLSLPPLSVSSSTKEKTETKSNKINENIIKTMHTAILTESVAESGLQALFLMCSIYCFILIYRFLYDTK